MTAHEPAGLIESEQQPTGPLRRLVRDERVAFILVGAVNTAVGVGWFVLFHYLVGAVLGYMGTLVLAHVAAVLCAFVMHRRLVFRVRGHVLLDLARFEVVNLGALALNAVILPVCVEVLGFDVIPAQLVATALCVTLTYLGHRMFSFRRPPPAARPSP